jgi:hypothetical protein
MKNDIPWRRKHRTSNGKCKLYPIRILGTFLNGMVTVRYITSLCTSVRTKQTCTKRDGLLENSYFGFSKKKLLTVTCVIWFPLQLLSEDFLILRRTERDMIKNVYWHSCKVSIILARFEWNLNFFDLLSKKFKYQIFRKSIQWEPSCSTQTDMTKLLVAFRNFAKSA